MDEGSDFLKGGKMLNKIRFNEISQLRCAAFEMEQCAIEATFNCD
jgi:hypothetical protein